ncbi:MAG: extracellular solute-binding protein [Gemmatimonadales bacterium]
MTATASAAYRGQGAGGRGASGATLLPAPCTLLLALLVGCGDGRTPLVVYSPHGRDLLSLFEERFEAAHPDIDLRYLDMGSQDALDRVRTERANPQADVWFGGPSALFARAAAESLLTAYRPSWADHIAPHGWGAGDLFFAAYETPGVIYYNAAALRHPDSADDGRRAAPSDWDDVLTPAWHDQVLIRDPIASGTMRAIFGMIIQRGLRETGDTAWGFHWLRRLDANTREYALNPSLLDQKLIRQEGLVSLWDLPDVLIAQGTGAPVGFVLPTSGAPVIVDGIAIVRGSDHSEAAQRFVEWVGTVAAQLMAARAVYRLPARLDLPADSVPDWYIAVRTQMVVAEMDWEQLADRGNDWMQWWDRHVRNKGAP